MTAIDRAALIEAAAAVLEDSYARWCDRVEAEQVVPETEHEAMAEAVLPVIARELLAPLREVHRECDWMSRTPGRCWHDGRGYPCPTVRLLDQIESDAKGDER